MRKQITSSILMVRPANFGYNPETAENNAFQINDTSLSLDEIRLMALNEFDVMVSGLRERGIHVIVVQDTPTPLKTDAVFPNNWISTHSTGELYIYPMFSPNRRNERRVDIVAQLASEYNLKVDDGLLRYEEKGQFLEGTGSMILDRENHLVYACYSQRTNPELLEEFAEKIGYEVVGFHAHDDQGIPYYHTNVIMALGEHVAIICLESIESEDEKEKVVGHLNDTNKTIVDITRHQILQFAGNMLEVLNDSSQSFMVMSSAAYNSLTPSQIKKIEKHDIILHFPLPTIEKYGGGSARCMMAEIYFNASHM